MNVLFDDQIFGWQRFGGISRYIAALIESLQGMGITVDCHVPISDNVYFQDAMCSHPLQRVHSQTIRKSARLLSSLVNRSVSLAGLLHKSFDVFHPTYYNPYFLAVLRKPFVVTVHDMTHELFPSYFWDARLVTANKKLVCQRAHKIIAISQSTKDDLLRLFPIHPAKVEVVHHGVSLRGTTLCSTFQASLPSSYVLFVGSRKGYKNFDTLFDAIVPMMREDRDLHLVCTGAPFSQTEKEKFAQAGVSKQMHQRFVEEEEFYTLYHCAQAFVFPSLYEGFGMPVLEAFLAECPTLLSDASSLPEVGGEAAVYFDPSSVDDLRSALQRVVYNSDLQESLREAGLARAADFTWEQTARQTADVYASCLSS